MFSTRRIGDIARAAYGGVSAMLQNDRPGSDVMIRDLAAVCDDVTEAMWALAILTLERLGSAAAHRADAAGLIADALIADAQVLAGWSTGPAPATSAGRAGSTIPLSVQAAACRLDSLRVGDLDGFAAATVGLQDVVTDFDLLVGATALLAAAVRSGAHASNRQADDVCRELCLAAVFAADG